MDKCFLCGLETSLYDNGIPVCATCSDGPAAKSAQPKPQVPTAEQNYRDDLLQAMIEATALANAASTAFSGIADDLSGKFRPNGVQRIHETSGELLLAREEMRKAHNRLNDFLARGIVPEDLKWQD